MRKKLLIALLAIMLSLGMSVNAFAEELDSVETVEETGTDEEIVDVEIETDENEICLEYLEDYDDVVINGICYEIVYSSMIGYYAVVTGVQNEYFGFKDINLVIPEYISINSGQVCKVTEIDDYAFRENVKIVSVSMPDTIVTLDYACFLDCTNLKSVKLSKNISSIPGFAFSGCSNLSSITLPANLVEIENCAFQVCNNLKEIKIPNKVEEIGDYAFYGCNNLTSITLPNSVSWIGYNCWAFAECENLKTINITCKSQLLPVYQEDPYYEYIKVNHNTSKQPYIKLEGSNYHCQKCKDCGQQVNMQAHKYVNNVCVCGKTKYSAGWKKTSGKWWYQNADGTYPKSMWQKISGKWYHFNSKGYMQTGWIKLSNKWYYLNSSGAMVTGWKKINSKWYYFNKLGVMQKSKWVGNYYLQSDGTMATNKWIGKYYVNNNGLWILTRE